MKSKETMQKKQKMAKTQISEKQQTKIENRKETTHTKKQKFQS